jgi:pimeloyl-ACP methyl ester carboxylesterase
MISLKMHWLKLAVVCAALTACVPLRSIEGPMNLSHDILSCDVRPSTLIVLLPGAYDTLKDFMEQGFVEAVRARNIDADIQLVDAHINYYTNQQIVQRLQDEVVGPAKAKGYKSIWFAGISLGGYGTLLYSMRHADQIDGFFIMAPYMGPRDIPAEIHKQGGLKHWTSEVQGNIDVDLWRWLKGYATQGAGVPNAYLGYGISDRFENPNGLLAEVLPRERSFVIPGGHDWATWRQLWANFLDTTALPSLDARKSSCKAQ